MKTNQLVNVITNEKSKTKNKQTNNKKKNNKKINTKGYICIFMFDMINNHNQYL